MAVLSPELRAWLTPGLVGVVASVRGKGMPEVARVWAFRVVQSGDALECYVQRGASATLVEGIARHGRAALNLIELPSYRSRMFKGSCALSGAPVDMELIGQSLRAQDQALSRVGMPVGSILTMLGHAESPRDFVGLRLLPESVFDQSPKLGAGGTL